MTAAGTLLWILRYIQQTQNSYRVNTTGPVLSSGGTAPIISMPAATTSAAGHLTAADWNTFNSKQAGNANLTSIAAPLYNHFFSKNDGCRNIFFILKTGCFYQEEL
jgi:hypothetical protein